MGRVLRRMDYTQKKAGMPEQAQREDVAAEGEAFFQWLDTSDATKVKLVDESALVQGMRLAYG